MDLSKYSGHVVKPEELRLPGSSILVYGPPGTGKTTFLGSVQDVEELCPMLIIDTEGSTTALGSTYDPDKIHIVRYSKFSQGLIDLLQDLANKPHPYKTVAIDTLPGLQQLMIREASDVNQTRGNTNNALKQGSPTEADWGAIGAAMNRVLDSYAKANFLFVATAHEMTDGQNVRPAIQGRMTPNDLPGRPAVVLYSTVVPPRFGINEKGDEPLYVMHSGFGAVDGKKTLAKDRTRALPAIMSNVTFKKLMHYTTQKENKA